ncbi:MAG: bifunctional riboflavin kinase/FAD synthetase [Myxococcota bacterium]
MKSIRTDGRRAQVSDRNSRQRRESRERSRTLRRIAGSAAVGRPMTRPVVTVGNFDGVHRGHQAILETVVERAKALSGQAVVYTFEPHPRKVLSPDRAPGLLTTLDQKIELLGEAGVDAVIVEPFNLEFAKIPPERFIREYLHDRIRPVEVYVGYDFHFGRDRVGSMRTLTEIGSRLGFSVTIIPEVSVDGNDVNSTRIRQLVTEARLEQAAVMLGRTYSVRGRVVEGDRRGRTLGFPTANLDPDNEVLPGAGVYAGEVGFLDPGNPAPGQRLPAVINVGTRPTFQESKRVTAEAHLIDFDGDLYGRQLEFSFRCHLRPERRFSDVEALKTQIGADVADSRRQLQLS